MKFFIELLMVTFLLSIFECRKIKVSAQHHHNHHSHHQHVHHLKSNSNNHQKKQPYNFEHQHLPVERFLSDNSAPASFVYPPKSGYSVGSGLRSIAQGSADQANVAVASQNVAAQQAAFVAKNTLAQTAAQAASTALAALKGKEILLQRLEQQSVEAHKSLENELTQLQQAKRAAKAAQNAARQAANHVTVLTAALNNAQSSSEHAQKAAEEAAAQLAAQTTMVGDAKLKVEHIEQRLQSARIDYEATHDAAEKASNSAQEAKNNANEAALHASLGLHESTLTSPSSPNHQTDTISEISTNHNYDDAHQEHTLNLQGY